MNFFNLWALRETTLRENIIVESVLTTSMSKQRGFTKFSVFLKRVSLLIPQLRMNFLAFPLERTRKEPRSSVRFWAATGV